MELNNYPIWEVLSCKGKVKVLHTLMMVNELNITEIVRQTTLSHQSVKRYLTEFCDIGLVELKKFGRIRIYRYKIELPRARALQYAFERWKFN